MARPMKMTVEEARTQREKIIRLNKSSKYRNIKTGGYDSKKEAKRAAELKLLEKAGSIQNLREQVRYELIPAQYLDGKCIERAVSYVADFFYDDQGVGVVEDVKSPITRNNPVYAIKRKLMLYVHGIRIREV